jgi:hypothetical protein
LALVSWLEGQGFTSRIEHVFKDGGRADLHVIVDDEDQTIEVQLSPMPETEWVRRDAMYRSQVSVVTWLYGPDAEARALDEMIERDVSLYVDAALNADGANVQIGTQGIKDTAWVELGECKLTPTGFWTPHLAEARAQTAAWRAGEDAAARLEAEEEAKRRRRQQEDAERENERIKAQKRFRATPHFLPTFKAPAPGPYSWTLENQPAACPESKGWTPEIGWGWLSQLPPEYRESARLLAYLVCTIDAGGPLYELPFDDVPDPDGHIADALVNAGFIVLCAPTSHPRRWRRADL